ncbi:MAG: hypothetical protein V1910_02130 [bacterium]
MRKNKNLDKKSLCRRAVAVMMIEIIEGDKNKKVEREKVGRFVPSKTYRGGKI